MREIIMSGLRCFAAVSVLLTATIVFGKFRIWRKPKEIKYVTERKVS